MIRNFPLGLLFIAAILNGGPQTTALRHAAVDAVCSMQTNMAQAAGLALGHNGGACSFGG